MNSGSCKLSFFILLYVCVISKSTFIHASLTIETIELDEKATFDRYRFLLHRFFRVPETYSSNQRLTDQHFYLPLDRSSEKLSTTDQCALDVEHVVSNIEKLWALKMMDSFGKFESGLLYGRFYWTGNYEECLNISAPPGDNSTGFDGRYCSLTWLPKGIPLAIQSAVCVPSSCSASKLQQFYNFTISYLERLPIFGKIIKGLNLVGIRCIPESVPWDKSAIGCLCFIALLTGIVLFASAYDLYVQRKPPQIINDPSLCNALLPEEIDACDPNFAEDSNFPSLTFKSPSGEISRVLQCFSALKNGSAIFDTSRSGQLDCLHGARFLSMSWVILGHTYIFGLGQMSNIVSFLESVDSFSFLIILQGTFSVDSFFVLSGFLLAYLFLKDGPVHMGIRQWVGFYAHRYLRLTPTYALLLGVWASVWLYVGSGPFWLYDGSTDQINCQTNWWQNLLYINNFPNASTGCMGWGWYLANDMQFFVISPIFLIPLLKWPLVGCLVTFILLLASWIATGVISYQHNFTFWETELTSTNVTVAVEESQFFDLIYDKPYTRIGPYLIGVLVAVSYLHYRKKQYMMSKWLVIFGWASATAVTLLTVYGIYHVHFGVVSAAFYYALSRSAFALGLGWLIFACLTDNGGPVNWILSWKVWIPLSRLTYCAYLLHPMIMLWYFGSLKDTFYFSHNTMIMIFFSMMVVSYGAAFITSLVVESPVISLEKYIRNRHR